MQLLSEVSLCDYAYGNKGLEACLNAIFDDIKAFAEGCHFSYT